MENKIFMQGQRNFLALWLASSASYFAYWIMQQALVLFAHQLSPTPLVVASINTALTIPTFACGLLAGALVDHFDRRHLLLVNTGLRLLAFGLALLAALFGLVSLDILYLLALVLGLTQTLAEPAFFGLIPLVVPARALEKANSFIVGAQNMLELLALPLGSLLASIGTILTLSVGNGCAVAALYALFMLRGNFRPQHTPATHPLAEVFAGLRYLWREPALRALTLMAATINLCWQAYLTILVLYAVKPGPMDLSEPAYGLLLAGVSLGSFLGAILTLPTQRLLGRRWLIGLNIIGNVVMFGVPALSGNPWLVGASGLLGGIGGPMWTIAAHSLLGCKVPSPLLGRVSAAYSFLGNGIAASGPLLGGILAQTLGLQVTFALSAGLTLLMLIPFFLFITEKTMTFDTA
jgi:MFS family permease